MVNLQVVDDVALVPCPFGPEGSDPFEDIVRTRLEGLGLTVHFLDDWEVYHVDGGEVHCGTNVMRDPQFDHEWWQIEN